MRRKGNIAVFLSNWSDEFQTRLIEGIWKEASQREFNVSVFTCQGGIDITKRYDAGEYNIYELANLERFDGIIIAAHIIISEEIKQKLIKRIRDSKVPAVSLEEKIDGFTYVGIDNYRAMYEMMEHLVKKHKYRNICFAAGPLDNYESKQRLAAYIDIMKKYKQKSWIQYGNYTFESGNTVVEEIFRSGKPLPQVIVCANDAMALGVCHELKNRGKKVPKDIAVTGFDNVYDASNYFPRITSVERPKEKLGRTACNVLFKAIRGDEIKDVVLDTRISIGESCGCSISKRVDFDEFREQVLWRKQKSQQYNTIFIEIYDEMIECDNFHELQLCIKQNLIRFTNKFAQEVYLCFNKSIYEKLENSAETDYQKKELIHGYEEDICNPLFNENSDSIVLRSFKSEMIFPNLWNAEDECNLYLFSPIHFREKSFGYAVLCGSLNLSNLPYYFTWIKNISNVVEEMQNILLLNRVIKNLNELSLRDSLTGVYNRFAIERYVPDLIKKAEGSKGGLLYEFMDVDGLKKINDMYGHEAGDQAISLVAEVLKKVFYEKELIIRYGGDEFLIVAKEYSEKKIEEKNKQIDLNLEEIGRQHNLPFRLAVSKGYYIEELIAYNSIERCMKYADEKMYLEKCEKKRERV